MGIMADKIEARLRAAFAPDALEVRDVSHQHVGHAGAAPGGNSHFQVHITAAAFDGLTRLQAHRAVMVVLEDEFSGSLHALSLTAKGRAKMA